MFNYKVYDISWKNKFTINKADIKSKVNFTANINSWQWEINVVLTTDSYNINPSDILRVYRKTTLIYAGVFQNEEKAIWPSFLEVSYPVLGLSSLWNMVNWRLSTNYNQDPATTAKTIIDEINSIYNLFSYDTSSIPNYWSSVNITFDQTKSFMEALKKCAGIMWRYIYIDQNGKVFIKERAVSNDHFFTLWKDCQELTTSEETEDIYNRITVQYSGGSSYTATDSASITSYGEKDYYYRDDDFSLSEATEWATNFLANNKNPKKYTLCKINRSFDYDILNVWEIVKFRGIKTSVDNLQIQKVRYTEEYMDIEFDFIRSITKEIINITS